MYYKTVWLASRYEAVGKVKFEVHRTDVPSNGKPISKSRSLFVQLDRPLADSDFAITASPNGRHLAFISVQPTAQSALGDVVLYDVYSGKKTVSTQGKQIFKVLWSPLENFLLAFETIGKPQTSSSVRLIFIDTVKNEVTSISDDVVSAYWSRDGRSISYSRFTAVNSALGIASREEQYFRFNIFGGQTTRLETKQFTQAKNAAWRKAIQEIERVRQIVFTAGNPYLSYAGEEGCAFVDLTPPLTATSQSYKRGLEENSYVNDPPPSPRMAFIDRRGASRVVASKYLRPINWSKDRTHLYVQGDRAELFVISERQMLPIPKADSSRDIYVVSYVATA